ncbi:MAG: AzlC family ABC transporter permease [Actinomycetes bacterium]|jgi:predicted branched-subunit amino acid permease|nr:MAG: branched-chain amino acid permease [Actinomycetota bacterium]
MSLDRAMFRRGVGEAFPLFLTVVPFALVVGLAVVESGLNRLIGWSSSSIIFAGAAQLTVITLLGSGTAAAAAIAAGLVIQSRHLMYSAAMAPTFQKQPGWFRWLAPYALIDQMFALTVRQTDQAPDAFRSYYLGAMVVYVIGWNTTTALGMLVGPVVPDSWQLGFAIPLMFLALMVSGIDRWEKAFAAFAAAVATYLTIGLPNRAALIIGGVVGVVAGVAAERIRD